MAEPIPTSPLMVIAGAHVRDRLCDAVHTLRQPDQAASDALLIYDCPARDPDRRGVVSQTTHVGAILGRLVGGLKQVE
jgi:hypothetical protein